MEIEEFDPSEEQAFELAAVVMNPDRVKMSPQEAFIKTAKIFAPAGIGLVLIIFGLTNTGSFYTPATIFDGGILADVFYGWQAGNLMAMVGVILIYDAIKRSGYL